VPAAGQTRAYLTLILTVSIWASYPAMAKLALQDFPPFFLALARCLVASLFLVGLLLRSGADTFRSLSPAALRTFFVLGVTGFWMSTQFSYVGYYYTTAANAVLLQSATPVMVVLGARCFLGERLGALQWAGVGASAFGVLLVITSGRLTALRLEELRAGDFITIAALTGWSTYTLYGKRVLTVHSPELATTAAYVFGTLLMIPTAALTAPFYPRPRLLSLVAWSVVLYQAVIGALAHLWWYRAVRAVGPSLSAVFINLQPLVGVFLAWLVVGERMGRWEAVGGAFVMGGVALTTIAGAGSGRTRRA
jgi:drug/metabolite transporter (DMT)-like permease